MYANVRYAYVMLDHDCPAEAAAEMKPVSAHVYPPPDPAHRSDGGYAWATSGGAARPKGSIRRRNSLSARGPLMAMINAMAKARLTAVTMAVRCRCWPFEAACL